MTEVTIRTEYITPRQFLGLADIVPSVGDTRALLDDEGVLVNGDVEVRRGRKLYPGDIVGAFGDEYSVRGRSQ